MALWGPPRLSDSVTGFAAASHVDGRALDSITRKTNECVVVTSGGRSWMFEDVIVASGGRSQRLMPDYQKAAAQTNCICLTWFVAKNGPNTHRTDSPSSSGSARTAPCMVRPSWMGHGQGNPGRRRRVTPVPDAVLRELTPAEIKETTEAVPEFFPWQFPTIVRSDAFPDLFTTDGHPLLGRLNENSKIYCATGFSGAGFKNATGLGEIAAYEALGKRFFEGLEFARPQRFN